MIRRRLLVVAICFVHVLTLALAARSETAERLDQKRIDAIERLVADEMKRKGIPGANVAVAVGDRLCYEKGFGLSDVENGVKATENTRFRTASIAKPMTAVAAMSLYQEGKLDLDAPVQKYCPRYPEKRWTITSRQLLSHLAGVRHYKSRQESLSTRHFATLDDALSTFAYDRLLHEPETKYLYSSFGFNLLGSIVEGAAGDDFPAVLEKRVFAPAGMKATRTDNHFEIIEHRARGYVRFSRKDRSPVPPAAASYLKDGELINASMHDTSMKIPGGGLVSTASDLVRLAAALNRGEVLKGETVDMMWTEAKTRDGAPVGYALGWQIGQIDGMKCVRHGGGQAGTSTILSAIPERHVVVAVMCNLQNASIQALSDKMLQALVAE